MPAPEPKKNRVANKIRSHKFTPLCPVHGKPMTPYSWGQFSVYFRCDHGRKPCPHRGKAPRVEFRPITEGST